LVVFSLGFFTGFEILSFSTHWAFLNQKTQTKFFVGKSWPRKCIWVTYWLSLQIFALL